MKEQVIEGITVLIPETAQQLAQAVDSGQPFRAPDNLAREFGLPGLRENDDEAAGVLDQAEDLGVLEDIGPGSDLL